MIRYILSALSLFTFPFQSFGQVNHQAPWQQQVDYKIDVSLNPKNHLLTGKVAITYHNNSPTSLDTIYVHLWPNAYLDKYTPLAQQQLRNGNTKFYFSKEEDKGYISGLNFSINGKPVGLLIDSSAPDIGWLVLPKPLGPGEQLIIQTPFIVKVPKPFSRMGRLHGEYAISQWFPKIAMYDINGWHPMSYLDNGEYFDNFGNYDVKISVPEHYMVAATGQLLTLSEEEYQQKLKPKKPEVTKTEGGIRKMLKSIPRENTETLKTVRFSQKNVHDFAWFASPRFCRMEDSVVLKSGKAVKTYIYTEFENKKAMEALKFSIKFFSEELGEYPYHACSVVQGPLLAGGGMEYPMITVMSWLSPDIIIHEVGHNWFQGILATDERNHPWMDEGINSFYEEKAMALFQPSEQETYFEDLTELIGHYQNLNEDQAPGLESNQFTENNYGLMVYGKVGLMFEYLERQLGQDVFKKCMQKYYEQWKFNHPLPGDMQVVFEQVSRQSLDWFFKDGMHRKRDLVQKESGPSLLPNGSMLPGKKTDLHFSLPFDFKTSPKNGFYFLPIAGWNNQDRWMYGVHLMNETAFAKKSSWSFSPLYSVHTSSINGFANFKQRIPSINRTLYRTDVGLNVQSFGYELFGNPMQYYRIKPSVELHFKKEEKWHLKRTNVLSLAVNYIKSTGTNESMFQVADRIHPNIRYSYSDGKVINGFSFIGNLELGLDGLHTATSNNYSKLSVEAKKDFHYNSKKKKLKVRGFAGSFLHTSGNIDGSYRFQVSQNNGETDYLMEDLFFDRSASIGNPVWNRQVEQNMGGMRNNVLSQETDGWVLALNIESTLPGKIPIRPYFDIGLGSGPSGAPNYLDKEILYTGGLSLVVYEDVFEVYFPLLFSEHFTKYHEDHDLNFADRICFRLNIPMLNPKKWNLF